MAATAITMTEQFDNARRTLVVGLGETGLSVVRYLTRRGAAVAVVDSRTQPPMLEHLHREHIADVALFLGGFSDEAFARAEQLVVSPGVALDEPHIAAARARGLPVVGDIELFARAATAPVVAVTGSNGKSTVVTLLGAMARRAGRDVRVGGNLGTPALDLLGEQEPDLYVLELSSFQLETVQSLRPRAAVVLNVSEDHMDRYATLTDYAAAKQVIYRQAEVQVINADDALAAGLSDPSRQRVVYRAGAPAAGEYGLTEWEGATWLAHGTQRLLPVSAILLAGRHNHSNALAALALGTAVGLPMAAMLETLTEFRGLAHRMQFVTEQGGVRWYDDSKGTNVGATQAAIAGVDGPVVLIAGGDGKGQDFAPLAGALAGKGRGVVLIGRDAARLAEVLDGVLPVQQARDLHEAVHYAAAMAIAGDTVLLSPACASTDMFRNYAERGEIFTRTVRETVG
jgi:UDP-N-acetylmuramoylalanine--D-glutamate ligase